MFFRNAGNVNQITRRQIFITSDCEYLSCWKNILPPTSQLALKNLTNNFSPPHPKENLTNPNFGSLVTFTPAEKWR
jgi:hypothetical protein